MDVIRPNRLHAGDTVAVLSMSWGGPAVFPHVFDAGCMTLTERLGLHTREYPTSRLIVTNLDFGHTDPQWIMPLGVLAELDSDKRTFRLLEPAVA
jgi:hypothetical protein